VLHKCFQSTPTLTNVWKFLVVAHIVSRNTEVLAVHRHKEKGQAGNIKNLVEYEREVAQHHDWPDLVEFVVLKAVGHPNTQAKIGGQGCGKAVHEDKEERVPPDTHEVV
jgi:hypothetical protein